MQYQGDRSLLTGGGEPYNNLKMDMEGKDTDCFSTHVRFASVEK